MTYYVYHYFRLPHLDKKKILSLRSVIPNRTIIFRPGTVSILLSSETRRHTDVNVALPRGSASFNANAYGAYYLKIVTMSTIECQQQIRMRQRLVMTSALSFWHSIKMFYGFFFKYLRSVFHLSKQISCPWRKYGQDGVCTTSITLEFFS